jgi:hypothetical protein
VCTVCAQQDGKLLSCPDASWGAGAER